MRITEGTLNPKPISSPPSLAPTYLFVDRSQSCREMLCRLLAFPDSSLFSFLFFFLFVPYIFELSSEYHIDARFSFFLLCNLVVFFFVKTVILNHSCDFFLWVACFFLFFPSSFLQVGFKIEVICENLCTVHSCSRCCPKVRLQRIFWPSSSQTWFFLWPPMNKITLQRVKSKCYPPMSILQIMPEELSTHCAKEM